MRILFSLLLAIFLFSCKEGTIPDVSNIKIELKTVRFEKELFSIDSNQLLQKVPSLFSKYPEFSNDFIYKILGTDQEITAESVIQITAVFANTFRPIFDSCNKKFDDFSPYENEIREELQFVHYYFPTYKIPTKIYTFIGPLDADARGNILATDAIYVGLQFYLGKNSLFYKDPGFQEMFPQYFINRFEPEYIAVNTGSNIILDMFPEKNQDGNLSSQMIENGKRLYLLSKFLPHKKENLFLGYSEKQLKDCYSQERVIWDFFIQNDLLQSLDKMAIRKYTGEGPKTQELGEGAPGNIGSFVGWQIVKKFMGKYPKTSLKSLMEMDNQEIIEKAKYKP